MNNIPAFTTTTPSELADTRKRTLDGMAPKRPARRAPNPNHAEIRLEANCLKTAVTVVKIQRCQEAGLTVNESMDVCEISRGYLIKMCRKHGIEFEHANDILAKRRLDRG